MPFSDVVKLFSSQFDVSQFLPSLLAALAGVWGIPIIVDRGDQLQAAKKLLPLATTDKAVLAVAVAIVLSVIFTILSTTQVRLYEGYLGRRLWTPLRKWQVRKRKCSIAERDRLKNLSTKSSDQQQRLNSLAVRLETRFARSDRATMPTLLGNVYRAFEGYPNERYNFDGVVMWPRIQPLVPEAVRTELAATQSRVDLLLTSTTLISISAVLVVILQPFTFKTILMVTSLLVSGYLTYRGAVIAALSLGDVVRSGFDIGRKTLLETLGFELPASLEEERKLWAEVTDFLLFNKPVLRPFKQLQDRAQRKHRAAKLCLVGFAVLTTWYKRHRVADTKGDL